MASATSVADRPRFTALGMSFTRFDDFLSFAAAFFFAAIVEESRFVAEDDARAARVREIGPRPVDEHDDAVAKADEEENMDQQPEPPRKEAGHLELRQLHHGEIAAD